MTSIRDRLTRHLARHGLLTLPDEESVAQAIHEAEGEARPILPQDIQQAYDLAATAPPDFSIFGKGLGIS